MNFILLSSEIASTNEVSVTLELILAVLAIIISIVSVIFEYFWNQKINKTNLEADFFKDIYGEYLMKSIPEARNVIHYNNQIVSQTDDLISVLNDIRRSSLFFKYNDKKYYQTLCQKLQQLEDKLVKKSGKMTDDDYAEFIQDINTDIEEIYSIIMKKYVGKKIRGNNKFYNKK